MRSPVNGPRLWAGTIKSMALFCSLIACLSVVPVGEPRTSTQLPVEALRFQVKAASNAPADQRIKNEVAAAVLDRFARGWKGCASREELYSLLLREQLVIGETAKRVLREKGFREEITVRLGKSPFPARLYGGVYFPPGEYEALVLTIGSGQGENWWCVIFPPLCFGVFPAPPLETHSTENYTLKVENNSGEGREGGGKDLLLAPPASDLHGKNQREGNIKAKGEKGKRHGQKWRIWLFELFSDRS